MSDNVGYTPGSGELVATRQTQYSGQTAQVQVVGLATLSGDDDAKIATDLSPGNPMPVAAYGELIEAIEALRMAVHALTRSGLGQAMPDTAGRLRVLVEQATAGNLQGTFSIAGGQTLATLTNQVQMGGLPATEQIPSLMRLGADSSRRNIAVT
jgi:hypothetical protein